MTQPLVSIIINNYNYGRFLNEAINSALNQTYVNIEVIVVDDGSTDNSREIILDYENNIIPVFKENGGQGSAYNAGFLKSHGEFICNLDSDDILFPAAIEKAIASFDNEEIVKIQWPLLLVDIAGNHSNEITTKWIPPEGDLKSMIMSDGPFYDFNLHVGSLVRRSLLEFILPMPEAPYRNGGDMYPATIAPIFGLIRNIMEPLGTYRRHGANNYLGRNLDEDRIRNYMQRFETNCDVLAHFAKKLGFNPDKELWKKRNFNYLWPDRLLKAKKDIERFIGEGDTYVLVNEDEWGAGEPVKNRRAVPFTELNDVYNGLPEDDDHAIKEIKRLKNKDADFIVIWWTTFWIMDHYKNFHKYLDDHFQCLLKNEYLIIYKM